MKRYILFGMMRYYPSGGAADLINDFDNCDEAINYYRKDYKEEMWDKGNILDTKNRMIKKIEVDSDGDFYEEEWRTP